MVSKQEIINVAFSLFARKGFGETTTTNIAKELGLKKQSLYSHFKSKNEILLEVLKEQSTFIVESVCTTIEELKDESAEILLKGVFEKIIKLFSDRELLMLWKRMYLLDDDDEIYWLLEDTYWPFELMLRDALFNALVEKSPSLQDRGKFRFFFLSYIVFIHGYLDFMLVKYHALDGWQDLWDRYWNGIQHHF